MQADVSHQDHAALFPAHAKRRGHDRVRRSGGGDDHPVGPQTLRQPGHLLHVWSRFREHAHIHAQGEGQIHSLAIQIGADHPTTIHFQELTGQLTQQSQANDDEGFTQGRRTSPYALQGNRSQGDRAGLFGVQILGNWDDQVSRYPDHLGMVGVLSAGTGHAVSGTQIVNPLAGLEDGPRGGVACRSAGRESPLDLAPGPGDSLA